MGDKQGELTVFVGCYTTSDRKGHGEGISAYRMDCDSGAWQPLGVVARVANPSFLALHPNKRFLYSVHGGQMAEVSGYEIVDVASGRLNQLGIWPSGGTNPVHLDVQREGRWLVVANYTGGSVAVLPITADGCIGAISDLVALAGECGPNPVEQNAPHPHDIPFDASSTFVAVPDKGLDRVFAFRVDREHGRFVATDPPSVVSAPGAGPRHIAFHPTQPWAYVINELNTTISAYAFEAGGDQLHEIQTLSSLPGDASIRSTGSEVVVHSSGRFVYVSNRGHNSVGAFAILDDGRLRPICWFSSGGDTPRAIALDPSGRFLYAANQASDTIVGFRVDQSSGAVSPLGEIVATGSPSTLVFVGG